MPKNLQCISEDVSNKLVHTSQFNGNKSTFNLTLRQVNAR